MTTIATFYRFADFNDFEAWRQPLREMMDQNDVRGTILLAPEGLNSTISGPAQSVQLVLDHLQADTRFADLDVKYSKDTAHPFARPKVKLKKSIITMGDIETPDAVCATGKQCTPQEWDVLVDDPDVAILDTRNEYETYLGTFENATLWPMRSFSEIIAKVETSFDKTQKIAMFCTGGVRCEKLSSWMLQNGYENLYQLEGGIVRYLEKTPEARSKWQGSCYVFDERIAVGHGNKPAKDVSLCPNCDHPLREEDRNHLAYLPAIQCGHCV
ncbi:MAG: rhodanese-like domain-containing protein [Rickettsiales bacterium]|nr:rhodanese-like domain-containing protein [Rickettsiales bacterium]